MTNHPSFGDGTLNGSGATTFRNEDRYRLRALHTLESGEELYEIEGLDPDEDVQDLPWVVAGAGLHGTTFDDPNEYRPATEVEQSEHMHRFAD